MVQVRFSLLDEATRVILRLAVLTTLGMAIWCSARVACGAFADWATGETFARQLELPSEIHWQQTPLRDAVQRLARAQRVCILLDRRLDPDKPITASQSAANLLELLSSVGQPLDWGVSVLSPVIYIGPSSATTSLATWYAQQEGTLAQLPRAIQQRWRRPADAGWPALTEPRRLIEAWLRAADVPALGLERIPHDLWPAQEAPRLDLLHRLTLALAGFQLAPQIEADGSVQIVALPTQLTLTKDYRLPPKARLTSRNSKRHCRRPHSAGAARDSTWLAVPRTIVKCENGWQEDPAVRLPVPAESHGRKNGSR